MLILVLAANTGFADFPRLASFQAGDSFLPRQLTKRGHRLVFSNGIIALAGTAAVLVVVTNAAVTRLIPLYAIGVFVGFTLSQAGMTKHHLRLKEPGWRSSLVHQRRRRRDLRLRRGHRAHHAVRRRLDHVDRDAAVRGHAAAAQPAVRARGGDARARRARRGHRADPASPRGAGVRRPARHGLRPCDPVRPHAHPRRAASRALRRRRGARRRAGRRVGSHRAAARAAGGRWTAPTAGSIRAAVECVVRELADGETEVSVLLPDRKYRGIWHRVLHDKTADAILEQVSRLPHANVTTVPFHLDSEQKERGPAVGHRHAPHRDRRRGPWRRAADTGDGRRRRPTGSSPCPAARRSPTPGGARA